MLDPLSLHISLTEEAQTLPRKRLLEAVDVKDEYVLAFDYSTLSDFLACDRRGENKMVWARERRAPTVALEFGRLFHKCEELRLRHGNTEVVYQRQREAVAEHFMRSPVPPEDYRNGERMLEVLGKYNRFYALDRWHENVYKGPTGPAVEIPFRLPLCTISVCDYLQYSVADLVAGEEDTKPLYVSKLHFHYIGKIDAVLDDGHMKWIVDHKTTSRGGTEFQEAFQLSLQTRGYCWAAQKIFGFKPSGLILNGVIVRPPSRTGVGTEFVRPNFFYSQSSLDEFERNAQEFAADITNNLLRGFWPQRATSFRSPCAWCDYHENCQLPAKDRKSNLESSAYRDVVWSPLHVE